MFLVQVPREGEVPLHHWGDLSAAMDIHVVLQRCGAY